ncbi:MAG: transcriptional regulator, partial [Lachnospiraceae bacterium]|nr:transcriptional regulator [Lachnospiraceae bacterium]
MKLSKTIAQKIVGEMMSVLPYNVNVMNEKGIIIGSGDKARIGQAHEGAIEAIKRGMTVEIREEADKMKAGINEPIILNGELIGVIGITGNPDEVRPFGKIVKAAAMLLIEQTKSDEENHNRSLNRHKFYLELSQKAKYEEPFLERGREYGMDLTKEMVVVITEGNVDTTEFKGLLQKYPHHVEVTNQVLFFATGLRELEMMIQDLKENPQVMKISVGTREKLAAESFKKAELALEVGQKVRPSAKVYLYEELRLLINISHPNKEFFGEVISNLDKAGN